jgi:hypothetical protein
MKGKIEERKEERERICEIDSDGIYSKHFVFKWQQRAAAVGGVAATAVVDEFKLQIVFSDGKI